MASTEIELQSIPFPKIPKQIVYNKVWIVMCQSSYDNTTEEFVWGVYSTLKKAMREAKKAMRGRKGPELEHENFFVREYELDKSRYSKL